MCAGVWCRWVTSYSSAERTSDIVRRVNLALTWERSRCLKAVLAKTKSASGVAAFRQHAVFCAMIPLILWFHDSAYIIRHRLAECSFHLRTNMRDFSSTYIKFVHVASFWRREPVSRQVSGCFQCQQVLRKCWATESAQLLYILRPLHTYVHEWQKALFYGARRFLSSRAEFRHLSLKSCMCFFPSCTWEREI